MIVITMVIVDRNGEVDIIIDGESSSDGASDIEADAANKIALSLAPVLEKLQPGSNSVIWQKKIE